MTFPTLETEHIVLREIHDKDVDALFNILSNKIAMKYWDSLPHDDIETTKHIKDIHYKKLS